MLVTERIKPFVINGKKVYQVEIPWHWGYQGVMKSARGDITNDLVASLGDPTTFIQESKAYCGSQRAEGLVRLLAEDAEEGYAIFACKTCRGYVKELDRRVRWNVGPALVEDWGTPHLDLVARREEYWRAVPTLIQIGGGN